MLSITDEYSKGLPGYPKDIYFYAYCMIFEYKKGEDEHFLGEIRVSIIIFLFSHD